MCSLTFFQSSMLGYEKPDSSNLNQCSIFVSGISVCSASVFALVFDLINSTNSFCCGSLLRTSIKFSPRLAWIPCLCFASFSSVTYLPCFDVQTERLFFVGYDFVRPLWGWSPVPLLWYFPLVLSLVPQSFAGSLIASLSVSYTHLTLPTNDLV